MGSSLHKVTDLRHIADLLNSKASSSWGKKWDGDKYVLAIYSPPKHGSPGLTLWTDKWHLEAAKSWGEGRRTKELYEGFSVACIPGFQQEVNGDNWKQVFFTGSYWVIRASIHGEEIEDTTTRKKDAIRFFKFLSL